MPRRECFTASFDYIQVLDEDGHFDKKLGTVKGEPIIPDADAVRLYEEMSVGRQLDEVAFKLQRSGRMGTYPQNKGQEANAVGSAYAMKKGSDWLLGSYRENAAMFMHGLPMHYVLLHWMGDERGNQIPEGVHVAPIAIPIGTQMIHAAGVAWSMKLKGEQDRAAITYFGDGATSEGDFHSAMNFASVLRVPLIFYCQNNQWAISVPREEQMNSETVAQKAIAYGMPTVQVDGNDIFAVYLATKEARDRATRGDGPSFIEGITYRLGDHTTADDARRYRSAEEVDAWLKKDPLIRTRKYLEARGAWDDKKQDELEARAKKIVGEVVKTAEGIEPPSPTEFFDHMYNALPENLRRQRDTMQTHSLGQEPEQEGLGYRERQATASGRST